MMKKFAFLALSLCATLALGADMKVYKSPTCGCCDKWSKAMEQAGFSEDTTKVDDMVKVKKQFNVPLELSSCHTAIIDGYVVEGHVPADEVKRLLELKPKDAIGIAVPGMPMESQGMEQGGTAEQYDVILFKKDGSQEVFATYIGTKKLK
jgi:copG protein